MGQAKLRGTRDQRVVDGIAKAAVRRARAQERHQAFLKSLTPKEKAAIASLRTFAAFAGVQL